MNHVFCTIWSKTLGAWVVASELATQHGKSGGADKRPGSVETAKRLLPAARERSPWAMRLVALAALLALYAPVQAANVYWDPNASGVGLGGDGTWNTTSSFWNTTGNDVAGPWTTWNNAALDTAIFSGTAGTLSLGAPITANRLTFNVHNYTITGNTLTLGGATPTIDGGGNATIGSVIAGTAGLTKAGNGTLTLTGTNTFSGGISVNAGTLSVSGDAALGSTANGVTMANGTALGSSAALSASRVVTLSAGNVNVGGGGVGSARFTGTGNLGATSGVTMSNAANDYTGRTSFGGGGTYGFTSIADLGVASALGAPTTAANGLITVSAGGGLGGSLIYSGDGDSSNRNFVFNNTSSGGNLLRNAGTGTLTLTGDIGTAGGFTLGMTFSALTADMQLLGTISSTTNRSFGFSGGVGRTITLGGANTYAGASGINGVTVRASTLTNTGTASSFGTGTAGGIGIVNGVLSYTGAATSTDRTLAIDGASTVANDGTGALSLTGATNFGAGGVDTLTLGGSHAGTNTLSGVVSGTGSIAMNGAGTWVLSGNNTYSGTTTVQGGTLTAGSAQAFGTSTGLIVNGGTLDLNDFAVTAPSLSGTGGTVDLGSGNLTLNAASGSTTYGGSIAGSGSLTKLGGSTQTLTGANTYTGATSIGAGTLALDFAGAGGPASNIISGASALNVNGGTLTVTGAAGEANTQTFNGLNVTAGSNRITTAPGAGGSVTVNLGGITRSGGLIDFGTSASGIVTTTNADGTLGGWATVNGSDYAKVQGGSIVAFTAADYSNKDDAGTWLSNEFISDAGGTVNTPYFGTVTGSKQLGGLQYTAAAASTVNVSSGETLGIDGTIVVASTVGNTAKTIQGGNLTGLSGGGTLGVLQNGGASSNFTIASTIVDNSGAIGFSKGGTARVTLTGANTYTGATTLSGGTLSVNTIANGGAASSIGASSGASSNLVIENGTLSYTGTSTSTDRGFMLVNGGLSRTIEVTNAAADLAFNGVVTSPDDAGFIKTGAGTLTLGNAGNNYVGATTVSAGTLAVSTLGNGGAASSIGASSSASANLVLQSGGELEYTGATASTDRGFTLGTGGGAVDVTQGATTLTVGGTVAGAGTLSKNGPGTLLLSGANTFTGGGFVNGGVLQAGSTSAFGTGGWTVAGGATLDLNDFNHTVRALAGAGTVDLGSATLTLNAGGGFDFTGSITGTGGVTSTGGTHIFSGCGNNYTGATTINNSVIRTDCLANGGLASGIGASPAASSNLTLTNNGILQYTGASVTIDRGINLGGAWGYVSVTSGTTLGFTGAVVGPGGLSKRDQGTLVLSGTNTYTGSTWVEGGILRAGSTNAFGSGGMRLLDTAGATLDLNGFDTSVQFLQFGGPLGGNVTLGTGTLTITNGSNAIYEGAISGTGGLRKSGGPGAVQVLTGCASSYTGSTVIDSGGVSVDCLANGGSNGSIGASSAAASNLVLNGGYLQYSGAATSTDRLFTLGATGALSASGSGPVSFTNSGAIAFVSPDTASQLTLTGANTDNNSLAAQITNNGTGTTLLTKTGTGTWILNNSNSTYTGITTISGGVLGVDKLSNGSVASSIGASTSAAANLVIGTGATLRYTGTGDTTDRLFTLSAGSSVIESSGTGAVVFSNTGSAAFDLAGPRTLALGGTNTGANTMGGTIVDQNVTTGKTTLAKNGSGNWILTGNNTFTGNTVINEGNLTIGNGGTSGNAGAGNVFVVNSTSTLSLNRSDTFNFTGTISGAGNLAQIGTGTTVLTAAGNAVGGTTSISAGTLQVNGALATAGISMTGTSALTVNGTVQAAAGTASAITADAGASALNVNAGGTLRANGDLGAGTDILNLNGTLDTSAGTLNLGAGNDLLALNDGGTIAGTVNGGSGGESAAGDTLQVTNTAARTLDGTSTAGFETLIKQGSGTLTLTGTQSYAAGTTVQAGTLLVNGNQAGAGGPTTVQSGATLGGSGTVAGDVSIASGATLSPGDTGAVGALTINGNLTLNDGAALNYQFGQANVPGGPLNDLTTVTGNLTLDGMLNVNPTSGGSFTTGVYRVFNYAGGLTNNGLTIGSAPAGTYAVQTSVANQVNLVNSTGVTLNFWDGPGNQNDGTIQGGNGLWQNAAGGDSWTDQTANINATYADGAFAIFGGTAGTVTVDNSLGAVRASGMQFTVSGYTINGAPLTLTGAPSIIRVGDGTGAGAGMTATIDAALVGAGGVQKSDLGTLVLNGANTYTGGTTVDGGTLQVASDANLGSASGGLTLNGGALRNTAGFASARNVTLGANGGTFDTQAALTLSGTVGGPGSLTKTGGDTLTLTGSNTYTGGTSINGGAVVASADANLGHASGALSLDGGTLQSTAAFASARAVTLNAGGGTFQTTGDLTLTGAVGGAGALTKTDAGTLLLAANNTYAGGTTISTGTLQLGNGGTAGSIAGNVTNNGTFAFDRSDTYSFDGTISGSGGVTQQGTGITVLTGNNSYGGSTAVNAGTLIVNGNQSAAAGATSVAGGAALGGAALGGAGTLGGDVSVADGATLSPGNLGSVPGTLTINGNLALGNASTLSYNFGQANVIGGAYNDLTRVAGNLTLGGTLDVTTTPGATFDPGIYRVISYGGTLTNNGLVAGTMPSPSFYVQTSVSNQVNLVNTAGLPVDFWDGPGNQNDGVLQGGTGVWQNASGNGNWTLGDGSVNAPFQDASFAVFAAAAGTVTVDNSLGAVRSGGMQFAVDGYAIQGDAITLAGAPNILRVGDGTADGAAMTATIASALTGTGGVQKTDLGTLVLTGANTYGGGTTVTAGTLQLGNGGAGGSIIGDVANHGALVFNRSDSATFTGAVSGSGRLTQAGTGTMVLTGANTYLGATTVQAGALFVNGDQSGATGLATVQGGATLGGRGTVGGDVTLASGATLSPGDASAPGTLTVNGSLSLDSGSTLNYRFGQAGTVGGALNDLTVVHGNLALDGTLNVSIAPGGSSGPGVYRVFSYDGALTDNGLALGTVPAGDLFVQTSIAQQVNLVNTTGLTLNFWDGSNATGNGVVGGGDGTWRLGDNDKWTEASGAVNAPYSNGAFAVLAGTAGTVTIDNGNGQVEASGLQFAVDGYRLAGGTLALTGSAPTIRVGDGTAGGAHMTATIDAVLAGTGALTKTDLGTLVLNANNTYTGTTTVEAGTLAVNGTLGGSVNVLAAGRLQGSGTVGNLAVAGTIAPGNSIGTLTVNGNFTQAAGSTYEVEVDPASNASDLVHASGTASIASGAKLNVARISSSGFVVGNRYTVVRADGGVTGTYSLGGDIRTAFVQLSDSYDANNVYLNAEKVRSFTDAAGTANQAAVAAALDSLPQSNALANAVAFLPNDFAARDALNQLSVDIHASNKTALLEDSRFVREAAIDRLRTAACAPGSAKPAQQQQGTAQPLEAGCTPADSQARTAWGQVFGSWGSIDGNGNAAKLKRDIGGFVVGADTGVGGGWRVGALGGYSRASADTDARNSSAKTDSYHLGAYGGTQWGATALRLGASHSWNKIETSRSVAFAGFTDSLSADYDSTTTQLFGEAGHRIDAGRVALEPFARLAYVRVKSDAFVERGGLASLYGEGGSVDATFTTLGLRASTELGSTTRLRGMLGWRHAFGDTTPTSTHAFAGSIPFTLEGVPLTKNVAVVEAGVDMQLRPNLTLGASYSGQFGDGRKDHGFKASLNWTF